MKKKKNSGNTRHLLKKLLSPKLWRKITSVLLAITVFLTTYMMILPALTIDLDTVINEPGMDVAGADDNLDIPVSDDSGGFSASVGESQTLMDNELSENAEGAFSGSSAYFTEELLPESGMPAEMIDTGYTDETLQGDIDITTSDNIDTFVPSGESEAVPFEGEIVPEYDMAENEEIPELEITENDASPEMFDDSLLLPEESGEETTEVFDENAEAATENLPVDEQESIDDVTEPAEFLIDSAEGEENTTEEIEGEDINAEDPVPAHVLKAEGEDYRVTVSFGDEAEIPEDAELLVTEILSDEWGYDQYVNEASEALSTEKRIMSVENARFFDITIIKENEPVEPKAPVTVLVELADSFVAEESAAVIHYTEDEAMVVDTVDPEEAAASIEEAEAADAAAAQVDSEETVTSDFVAETMNDSIESASADGPDLEESYEGTAEELPFIEAEPTVNMEEVPFVGAEPVEEIDEENAFAEPMNPIAFVADSFSVYGFVTATLEKIILASDGHNYKVTVTCGADAGIPEDAELSVEEIMQDSPEYDAYVENAENVLGNSEKRIEYVRLFDIKIVDAYDNTVKYQPAEGSQVDVRIELADTVNKDLSVVHFGEVETEGVVLDAGTDEGEGGSVVEFKTDGFSVFAVAYTVDFTYEVNGKTYEFSIPGGGFVSFTDLVELLGIAGDSNSDNNENEDWTEVTENVKENTANEETEESGVDSDTKMALTLSDVEVSEASREFVEDVASVEFSSPSLVDVSKVDSETTVGQIKSSRGLVCQYSAELTEEQIEEINSQTVEPGDWCLIGLQPFTGEEEMTVTMEDGEIFTILVTDGQIKKTIIDAKGDTWKITVTYGEDAQIPDGAELKVREILPKDEEYEQYYQQSLEKVGVVNTETETETADEIDLAEEALEATEDAKDLIVTSGPEEEEKEEQNAAQTSDYARIFDIQIWADDHEVQPESTVDVNIILLDAPEEAEAVPQVVHFAKNGAELIELKEQVVNSADEGIRFVTNEFSVYSVVYTVDFMFNINGKECAFSLEGGDSTSFKEIIRKFDILDKKNTELFIDNIASVEFSNPAYLWNGKIEEDAFAGDLKQQYSLDIQYASNIRPGNILAMNVHHYSAPDWVLIALRPFTSEETLTVTMKNGETFTVRVTDAQSDAIHNSDGTVQTISNPQGTTMELFNYFVDSGTKTTPKRDQWPGHVHGDEFKFNWYDRNGNYYKSYDEGYDECKDNENYLLGYGNNKGINKDHVFKFSPANAKTVIDGTKNTRTKDVNGGSGLNGWTQDADPYQGLVEGTLYNGYPKLTNDSNLGTDGESLAYLFDGSTQDGKESRGAVNHLLYVDPDGYYTYDSRDFKAYIQNDGNFKVSNQPDSTDTELKGFWPFGDQIFWSGLHMNTQFSMPENGQVLNPKGEYKDMQFEFSGDDDTWLYIDGVLVGDGGGIHNRTEIDINFADGTVTVTGKKDTVHTGTFEETRYLDDIFREAGRYNDDEWEDIGDGSGHKRLKAGTYHTFDMFYLERGGGESNLYIHYNLVSTTDFTGHKAYEGFGESGRMTRDQFRFEMIGLEGRYESVSDGVDENGKTKYKLVEAGWANGSESLPVNKPAIMPVAGTPGGAGTVASPKKVPGQVTVGNESVNAIIYTTGVSEDGNINFGSAEINSTEQDALADGHGSVYKYIIREVVPSDAVNGDGITWAAASEEQKKAGGFVKDQVTYDGTIYYMTAGVTSWQQAGSDGTTHTEYGLRKTYYTDETFTTVADDISFVSFINTKAGMKYGSVDFTKTDVLDNPLAGAEFTLYKEEECVTVGTNRYGKRMAVTSGTNGVISFENIPVGTYYMKETKAPEGYALDNTVYRVVIEDSLDATKESKITINGDATETEITEIKNFTPGEIAVIKKWLDIDGNEINGGNRTVTVRLKRKHMVAEQPSVQSHTVTVQMSVENGGRQYGPSVTRTVEGNTIIIEWDDEWEGNFNWWLTVGGKSYSGWISGGNEANTGECYEIFQNGEYRKLIISNVTGNVAFSTRYWTSWLNSNNNHWNNLNNPTITGTNSGSTTYIYEDDTAFNNEKHTQVLSGSTWFHAWSIGGTESDYAGFDYPAEDNNEHLYLYYVSELNEQGNEVAIGESPLKDFVLEGYSSNNATGISNQGVITVRNKATVPLTGNLEITKTIRKNGVKDTTGTGTFYYAVYTEAYDAFAASAQTPVRTGSITVSSGGTAKATEEDLDLATYYVYELDKSYSEGGKPIISGLSGAVKALSDGVFTVTGSGTEVTLSDSSVPAKAELVNNVKTTERTVTKTWAGSTSLPEDVEVEVTISASGTDDTIALLLEASDIKTATVTLKKGEESKTWNNLPVYDSTGAEITYSVTETKVKTEDGEWTAETTPTLAEVFDVSSTTSGTTTTINNTPLTGKLDVTKELLYNGETDTTEAKDFYAALFVEDTRVSDVKTISVSNGSGTAEFTGLKAGIDYTLKETDAVGNPVGSGFEYNVSYENGNFMLKRGELEKTAKITNNKTETGQLTVNKSVLYNGVKDTEAGTTEEPAKFSVAIFTRTGEEGSYTYTQVGDPQDIEVVAGATTKAAVFTDLVIGTTYYAFEMDGENRVESNFGVYTVTNSGTEFTPTRGNKTGEMTVTNAQTEVGSLTVTKELKKADEAYTAIKNETFTVGLYEKVENDWIAVKDPSDLNENWVKTIAIGQGSSSGTAVFTPLTVGKTYRVYEVDDSGEMIETGQCHEYTVSYSATPEITIGRGTDKDRETTVTNTLETVTASVEKKWFNGETDITEQIENASASVRLTDGTNPVTVDADGEAFTVAEPVTIENGIVTLTGTTWTYTWSNLPKYNASGDVIEYTVEETAAKVSDDDLDVSEASTKTGTLSEGFLIKNTLPTVDVSATKVWQDKDGNEMDPADIPHKSDEEVKVTYTLLANTEPTSHTVEVNGVDETDDGAVPESTDYEGADWTAYFTKLPKYSDTGSLIAYTVKETGKWPGFEVVGSDEVESGETIINKQLVYDLKIVKVAKESHEPLTGAKFRLTRKLPGESIFKPFENDQFEKADSGKKTGPFEVTSENGIKLTNLLPGKYQLQETKAPDGYIITLGTFEFTINADGTLQPLGDGTQLVEYVPASGTEPAGYQIENEPGAALPSTGGPGTRNIYLLGSILLLGAIAALWTRRKMI